MGFGLHVGWAVEGAIGSSTRLRTYLSPHVNIAARSMATKQFGADAAVRRVCRRPLEPTGRLPAARSRRPQGMKEPMMLFSFEPRMDERKRYFDRFGLGVEAYLNGEWEQARALLEGCVNFDPGDGRGGAPRVHGGARLRGAAHLERPPRATSSRPPNFDSFYNDASGRRRQVDELPADRLVSRRHDSRPCPRWRSATWRRGGSPRRAAARAARSGSTRASTAAAGGAARAARRSSARARPPRR